MILPSQWQISLRCTATGSVTDTGLISLNSLQTWCLRRGELSPRSTFWMDALIPGNHAAPPPATSTSVSAASSARTPSRTPTCRQNPSPLGLVVDSSRGASYNPKDHCLADLVKIVLYFCLRSCEYTKTNSHRRTTQFRLRDIQFQDSRGTIPFDAPASRFLTALVVTLSLDTQKHYFRGNSISMKNTRLLLGCPVVACARRFLHLCDNDDDLEIPKCVYFEHKGAVGKSVTGTHLVDILWLWSGKIGFA